MSEEPAGPEPDAADPDEEARDPFWDWSPRVTGILAAAPFLLFFLGLATYSYLQGQNLIGTLILLPPVLLFSLAVYWLFGPGPPF